MASQSPTPPPPSSYSSVEQIDLLSPPPPPPPVSSSSSDSLKLLPTPFLTKTYQLVDDVSLDAVVSWNEDGTAFVVWNPTDFARDVLPKHFKHNNFSSFVRQLNTYGFRKIIPDRWEFSNDCFRRGDKRLLCDIVRRKLAAAAAGAAAASVPGGSALSVASLALPIAVSVTPSSSGCGDGQTRQVNSSWNSNSTPVFVAPSTALLFIDQTECQGSSSRAHLIDENDKLKKKNTQLYKELRQMKSMCTNIYSMMSNYNPGSALVPGLGHGPGPPMNLPMLAAAVSVGCGSHNSSQAESMMIPLQLMSGQRLVGNVEVETLAVEAAIVADEHLNSNPSLFGFQLGTKRAREGDNSEEPLEQDDLLQLQQPG